MNYIRTISGQAFDYANPEDYQYTLWEVSDVLARVGRFNEHKTQFYSVAQHCVNVSYVLEEWGCSPLVCMYGLLHELDEVFTGDIPGPLKKWLGSDKLEQLASDIRQAACKQLTGLDYTDSPNVHAADLQMLASEMEKLGGGNESGVEARFTGLVCNDWRGRYGVPFRQRFYGLKHRCEEYQFSV